MFSGSLRAFDAAVRTGSIRKASEELGVAPSSVSRHVAQLEREVGTPVFDRGAAGVVLTHAGRMVADYARSVLLDYDTLRTDLNDLHGVQRRLVRVALVESVATAGPIKAAAALRIRYPSVTFEMRQMPAPQVVEAVRLTACDVGLTFGAEPDPEIVSLAAIPEPVVALAPAGHALADAATVDLSQLAGFDLALPDSGFGVRRLLDRAAAAQGVRLEPALSSNVFEMLREFVRCGGVAVLPRRACPPDAAFRVIPLADAAFRQAHIDVIVLRRRRLPRIVRAFTDLLVSEVTAAGLDRR
ncbi:LysR family transcriptional regulator [Phenylobacterium sp.]|uniref:LysR family transcriptional regulator n=1 Tax=Phenylobacterium sp. TaxID=1871053 RepID=UPI0011F7D850|nr:LysR family transcriptional regulator [Phenylobacterium sp.]THD59881.1 MAG: LysR family transcriptional regulator [Phenylobacterium sp.]